MNTFKYCDYELHENLSEDILSEGASPSPVKVTKSLGDNMKMTSFNPLKFKNLEANADEATENSKIPERRLYGEVRKQMYLKNKYNSLNSRKRPSNSKDLLNETKEYNKCYRKMSLKDEISHLLKKSAEIRQSSFANPKTIRKNLPSESESNSDESGNLFTFGNHQ